MVNTACHSAPRRISLLAIAFGCDVRDVHSRTCQPSAWAQPFKVLSRAILLPIAGLIPTAFVDPGPTLQGNVTRNTLRGPGTAQVDFSAIKTFQLFERINTQFRAEAYNIINHPIFSQPASNISTASTVGKISTTSGDNRSIQLAVKVIF